MKRFIVGGSAALLMAAGLIAAAPPAGAGCLYGGPVISKCDGPIQPDGTWQRCVAVAQLIPRGASSYFVPDRRCDVMGPNQPASDLAFADPPTHIDD
ncbi:MAG: CDGP domain-containing protein [Mycobacterium sp.]